MSFFFFFNDTATTEIYTLSLHDALPIYFDGEPALITEQEMDESGKQIETKVVEEQKAPELEDDRPIIDWSERDRKSTRLNSSHGYISYAVFCLKKKKKTTTFILHTTSSL